MTTATIYGVADKIPSEIPDGFERISLVTDDEDGTAWYQVEKCDGSFYVCDQDCYVLELGQWTLQRVIADVPGDDSDEFFRAIEEAAK